MPDHPLDPTEVLQGLERACKSQNSDEIDAAILAAFQLDHLSSAFGPIFIRLLVLKCHHKHEDLVQGLQQLRDPDAVSALFDAASVSHEYLAYDEFFGLARKCTWALADIGTVAARKRLEDLATINNRQIAEYAQKRLDKWEAELHRKKR